jgi:amino acid transporter
MALMTASMPRVGGDYVFVSRLVHPAVALAGNGGGAIGASILAMGFWSGYLTTIGLGPVLAIYASVTGNTSLNSIATTLPANPMNVFLIGSALLVVMGFLSFLSTKTSLRVENVCYVIAGVGLLITVFVLLTTSHETIVQAFNRFAQPYTHQADSYNYYLQDAAKGGLAPVSQTGHDWGNTLLTVYIGFGIVNYAWWSTYMAAELRRANEGARQLRIMVGAGLTQGLVQAFIAWLLLSKVGEDFLGAINWVSANDTAHYFLPTGPYYSLFASLVANNTFIDALIAFTFLAWFYPAVYINIAAVVRCLFAYAFDGVLPRRLADVNETTHTPVVAIAVTTVLGILAVALYAFQSANFFTIFSVAIFLSFTPSISAAIAGLVLSFSKRHEELRRTSAASMRWAGIPLVPIASVGTIAVAAFAFILLMTNAKTYSGLPAWEVAAGALGVPAAFAVLYYVSRAIRKSQGFDLDLVYKEIPPL